MYNSVRLFKEVDLSIPAPNSRHCQSFGRKSLKTVQLSSLEWFRCGNEMLWDDRVRAAELGRDPQVQARDQLSAIVHAIVLWRK